MRRIAVLVSVLAPLAGPAWSQSSDLGQEPADAMETLQPHAADEAEAATGGDDPAGPEPSAAGTTRGAVATAQEPPDPEVPRNTERENPSGPGQFEVDEIAAERALERTLITTGALLLPRGQAEFTAGLRFSRSESAGILVLIEDGDETLAAATREVRTNIVDGDLDIRLGVADNLQLELALPYRYADQQEVFTTLDGLTSEESRSGHGRGDISLGLARLLTTERGWRPDIIGRVNWTLIAGTREDNDVSLGYGFRRLGASLTATKRQDPLVFVSALSYARYSGRAGIRPGDEVGLAIGTVLAASPETSLSFMLQQSFVDELKVNGTNLEGTDGIPAVFSLATSSIIGRGRFLSFATAIGLTDSAADYTIGITFSTYQRLF